MADEFTKTRDAFQDVSEDFLKAVRESSDSFSEMSGQAKDLSEEIQKSGGAPGIGANLEESLTNSLKNIPLIGGESSDSFSEMSGQAKDLSEEIQKSGGAPGIGANLEESLTNSLKNIPLIGDVITGEHGGLEFVQPLRSALDSVGEKSKNVFMNMSAYGKTAAIGIAAVLMAAFAIFKQWDEAMENFIGNVGLGRRTLQDLSIQAQEVYLDTARYGIQMDDVLSTASSLINQFGSMQYISQSLIGTTTQIGKGFAISEESAANIVRLQSQSLGLSEQQVKDFAVMAKNMSKVAGVAPNAIMESMASNTEAVAKFSRGTGENVLQAAVYAKALGAEFEDIVSMAENLMDIESSMNAAMEAQFFFGSRINMGLARRQAIEGDLMGMTETILGDLSKTVDLNNLNYLQRKQLSKIMGVSVDKAMQMVRNFERSKELTADMRNIMQNTGSFAEEMELSQMQTSFKEFMNILKYTFAPFIQPLVAGITKGLDFINKGLSWIGTRLHDLIKWTNGWNKTLKTSFSIIRGGIAALLIFMTGKKLLGGIKSVAGGFKNIAKGVSGAAKANKQLIKGPSGFTRFINNINPKNLIAVGFAMIELAGAVWILSKAMQNFSDGVDWKGVAMGVTSLGAMVLAVAALGALMSSGVGTVAILAGAAALAVIGGAMWIASKAMQGFAMAGQMILPVIEGLSKLSGRELIGVATGIGAIGLALTGFSGAAMIAGITSLVAGGIFDEFINLAKQSTKFEAIANSLKVLSGMSGDLQFSRMASEIELLVSPLRQVAAHARSAKKEMIGLAGATGAQTIIRTVGRLIGNERERPAVATAGKSTVIIKPADVILDGKKIGKILFNKMQGD